MRVLVIWPPHVPSYFNAGHHTPLYMTAGYLRGRDGVEHVDVVEAGLLTMNWKAVGDLLFQGDYDLIAIMNDIDAVDGLHRFLSYARALSPRSRLVAFGRLASMVPGFFNSFDLDAVVASGDPETGVADYAAALLAGGPDAGLPGVTVRIAGRWHQPAGPGRMLPAADWVLPDVGEIPYEAYDRLYSQDAHKFCGIPFRRELVVPTARGCPIGCDYCDVHQIGGLKERRLDVDRVLSYLDSAFDRCPFEYVAFYAPTFTLDRRWTVRLCDALDERPVPVSWKCSTTVHHLDEELVHRMGRAGCVRISVGLETLQPAGHGVLPRTKRVHEDRFRQVGAWCAAAGVELNAFVIVGLPGTTADGVAWTRSVVRDVGARFRPTVYTPFERLSPSMTVDQVAAYNRQLLPPGTCPPDENLTDLYRFVFDRDDRLTEVYRQIPEVDQTRRPVGER